jgi:hypothetical protein
MDGAVNGIVDLILAREGHSHRWIIEEIADLCLADEASLGPEPNQI